MPSCTIVTRSGRNFGVTSEMIKFAKGIGSGSGSRSRGRSRSGSGSRRGSRRRRGSGSGSRVQRGGGMTEAKANQIATVITSLIGIGGIASMNALAYLALQNPLLSDVTGITVCGNNVVFRLAASISSATCQMREAQLDALVSKATGVITTAGGVGLPFIKTAIVKYLMAEPKQCDVATSRVGRSVSRSRSRSKKRRGSRSGSGSIKKPSSARQRNRTRRRNRNRR